MTKGHEWLAKRKAAEDSRPMGSMEGSGLNWKLMEDGKVVVCIQRGGDVRLTMTLEQALWLAESFDEMIG